MTASNYPFLARNQKTEEERQRENIDALWGQLGAIGMNGGRSFFTGYGEDGKLQTDRPTGIMNTNQGPRTIHEAEQVNISPNGSFDVIPASQVGGQQQLKNIEQENNIKGYQFGTRNFNIGNPIPGSVAKASQSVSKDPMVTDTVKASMESQITPSDTTITDEYKPYTTRGIQRLERYADTLSPVDQSIREGERERFAGEAASARGALSQELAQAGISGREAVTEQAMLGRQIGAQESRLMSDLRKGEAERAFTAARQLPGEAAAARGIDISTQQWEKSFEAGNEQWQQQFDFEKQKYGDQAFARMADDAQTTSMATWLQKYPNATAQDYETAREYRSRQLQSMDIANMTSQERLDQLKTDPQWQQAQEFLAAGDYENYAAIIKGITGRNIDTQMFKDDRAYIEKMRYYDEFAAEIGAELQKIGLSNTQFDQIYDYIQRDAPLEAMEGLFRQYGIPENMIPYYYNELKTARRNQLDSENLTLMSQHLGVASQQLNTITSSLLSGVDVQNASQLLVNAGMNPNQAYEITQGIYDRSVRLGDLRESASTMLQSGDVTGAQDLFNQMYPGINFDFSRLTEEQDRADFAEGIGMLAQYSTMYDTYEDARYVMAAAGVGNLIVKGNAWKDVDGLEDNIKTLFETMKLQSDPVYRAMNSLSDDTIKSLIPPDSNMTVDQMRNAIGRLSAFGGMRMDDNGNWILDPSFNFGTDISVGTTTAEPGKLGVNPGTVSGSAESFSNFVGTEYGSELEAEGKVTAEMWADSKATTADEYREWYNSEGYLENIPTFPPNINANRGEAALIDVRNFWSDEKLSGLTNDQLNKLAEANSQFRASDSVNTAISALVGLSGEGGQTRIPDAETAQKISSLNKEWNNNIGKLINMNGKQYVIMGYEGGVSYVMDPQKPSSRITFASALEEARKAGG